MTVRVRTRMAMLLGATGLVVATVSGSRAVAQAQASCSTQWLRGSYAFAIDGTLLAGPSPALLRGVAMTSFDGAGGVSQVDFVTANGAPVSPDWRAATGTYRVDPDCTGTAELFPVDGSPALRLRLVVFDRGAQVRTVALGNAVGSHGVRVQ